MAELLRWFERVEASAQAAGLSVDQVCERLNISRGTYYLYRKDPQRHPRSSKIIRNVAGFLGEDEAALTAEMTAAATSPSGFLEAAAARELSTQLYQQHVRALAHVLGMGALEDSPALQQSAEATSAVDPVVRDALETPARAPRPQGVDVVVRLLREQLRLPPNPVDAAVVVLPKTRGGIADPGGYREPYQYQIYVLPEQLAGPPGPIMPPWAPALLERTREKVNSVLSGTLLPVTREHSTELALDLLAARADLLLYPGLLDMRAPDLTGSRRADTSDVLVTGVYYAGAPDVAALLARRHGYGFSTFDQLARLQVRAGLRGLPDKRLELATAGIAYAVLVGQSPTAGPMIWATNDPEPVLTAQARVAVERFPGPIVLLELSEAVLDYAAYRVSRVDADRLGERAMNDWRDRLRHQQQQLRDVIGGRAMVEMIELPAEASRRADGSYPDAVDAMFDSYDTAAQAVASNLDLV